MVNMPINVSAFPTDELGLVTDINQNYNQEYYEWLLKQHNYFPDCAFHKEKFEDTIKMEHSYTRDWKPTATSDVMATRTILVEQPQLCPMCHQLPPNHDEKVDTPEVYNIPIPPYNEEAGRRALNSTEETIKSCHNRNSDSDDWTECIAKDKLTDQQLNLFERVERILDMDQLGRLAVAGLSNECLRRNAIIEKSVSRMRAALASVHWEPRLTLWLHHLLMTHLPSNYMVSYIDILQTLKHKLPALVDKMLYHKPIDMHKDYLSAIMKKAWEPTMVAKTRSLPSNPVIVLISATVCSPNSSSREKRWQELLSTLTSVESVQINLQAIDAQKTLEQVTEHLVALTRAKIQEIRNQTPNRHVILAGFNAGASIALQVALVEPVNSVICLGFSYNTLNGVRGVPDDRVLDLTTPVLFVVGQNAQRSSQEEIESLRLSMSAQTLLVVVGSSDDALRVKRLNRSMEGVSQSMIDSMIMDEIQEFTTNCIVNPPGPRNPKLLNGCRKATKHRGSQPLENGHPPKRARLNGKQKTKANGQTQKRNVSLGRKRKIPNGLPKVSTEMDDTALQMAFESVLPPDCVLDQNGTKTIEAPNGGSTLATPNVSPSIKQKVKFIPQNQFVHIKPPPINTQKIYVKQQNGNQSYTLGVKNIGSNNIPVVHNSKLITTENNLSANELDVSISEDEDSTGNAIEMETSMGNIDIFDIPILFADDGNAIEEKQSITESPKITEAPQPQQEQQPQPQPPKPTKSSQIQILSDTIIKGPTNGEAPSKKLQENGLTIVEKDTEKPSIIASKPATRSNGKNFVILNKNAFSQMKTVKRIPDDRIKKFFIPRQSLINSNGLPSLNSKNIRISSTGMKMNVPKFQSAPRSATALPVNGQLQTNGRPSSPKSGILIKRNHLKNITVRKLNVVSTKKADDATDVGEKHENGHSNEFTTSNNNPKDESLRNLIAELEN